MRLQIKTTTRNDKGDTFERLHHHKHTFFFFDSRFQFLKNNHNLFFAYLKKINSTFLSFPFSQPLFPLSLLASPLYHLLFWTFLFCFFLLYLDQTLFFFCPRISPFNHKFFLQHDHSILPRATALSLSLDSLSSDTFFKQILLLSFFFQFSKKLNVFYPA